MSGVRQVREETNGQVPVRRVLADAVEYDHPACAAHCDEARQAVDQLPRSRNEPAWRML